MICHTLFQFLNMQFTLTQNKVFKLLKQILLHLYTSLYGLDDDDFTFIYINSYV